MTALKKILERSASASQSIAFLPETKVNAVLKDVASALEARAATILRANAKDLAALPKEDPSRDRLLLTEKRISDIAKDVRNVAKLPFPLGKILDEKTMPNGLKIARVSVPLGVIAIIYEARPNVTVDSFALCFKAGNSVVLKGGSEAEATNAALVSVIQGVLKKQKIDPGAVSLLPTDRSSVEALLSAHNLVDVVIPRGGKSLIDFVRTHTRVPVIETGAGVVHTYVDRSADTLVAARIVWNAKTRRPSVCNSLDTLLVHKEKLRNLPAIIAPLRKHEVQIFADVSAFAALKKSYPLTLLEHAKPEHFGTEFLSLRLAVKTVKDMEEALAHIAKFGSRHSEAIIAKSEDAKEEFLRRVDAAAVYANASTAFTDGGEFGLGAEIGISTQKLHARGPMGLRALTSEKWIVRGTGQIRKGS